MAMYYYASKLNEASCSGCHMKVPPAPTEPAPPPPTQKEISTLPTDPALLHGTGLSYYDNDDYYSMVRGNKFVAETTCKHIVMNGSINFLSAQKLEGPQISAMITPGVATLTALPYVNCPGLDPGGKQDVEYKDGQIISAPFDTLVDMLRPGATKSFTFTFLLCSRLFVKPHELLSKLTKRYFKNYEKTGKLEMIEKELSDMVCLVKFLSQWTSMFPYDFRDDRVMALVRSITQRCAAEHMATIRLEVSAMLEKLLDKLTALEKYEETLVDIPKVSSVEQLSQGDIITLGLTPVELANQLTIIELHKLSFVGPEEFVQTFAPNQGSQQSGSSGAKTTISLPHVETKSTKNLEAYAEWFNQLSYLVVTDILKATKSKYRARIIEQWVMTARECFNLGNFNSLMAIISALNMAPIARLKKTWSRTSAVCGQQLRQLELCVEPSGNHARYRAALAAAPTDTAVPLLSVTCRDLHFANQSAPSKLNGNRVNFEKCCVMARQVSGQLASRRLLSEEPCPAPPAPPPPAAHHFIERPALAENGLGQSTRTAPDHEHNARVSHRSPQPYLSEGNDPAPDSPLSARTLDWTNPVIVLELISFEREPPVDHMEKERLKRLRVGTY